MAAGDDMRKIFADMQAQQKKINAGAEKLEEGLGKQLEMQRDILKAKQQVLHIEEKRAEFDKKHNDDLKAETKLIAKLKKLSEGTDAAAIKAAKEKLGHKREEIKLSKKNLDIAEVELDYAEEGLSNMQQMVKESNKLKSTFKSMKGAVKTWGWDKLKSWGVFEMDKAIRDSARSMGVGAKNFQSFSDSISSASEKTIMMGAGIKDLAKMQGGYSKEIGRSVKLTEAGLIAMAEMAEGTGLGAEYAIGMAAGMDDFGASVETSRDLVQETLDISGEMGVNSAAAAEGLKKSLKLAQRFHFKGGVKGLAKMANEAARLKLDMDGIAGMAESVFRPEGAVEMAAKLQTMGGEFAKMADPMQMMFEARNDPAKFAKKIGAATAEFVEFNKESGTFEVKGGLAADRMREISKMTGIGVEKLQEMAVAQNKIEKIGSITPFNFSKDDKALVAGMAEFNKEDKAWEVNIDGHKELVKDLSTADLKRLKDEQQSLKKRAEQARTFQDTMNDIWEQVQVLLLPLAQSLQKNLGGPIKDFISGLNKSGFIGSIKEWVKGMADFVTGLAKPILDFIIAIGPKGTLAAIIGGGLLFNAAKWILNGKLLSVGFNMGARGGGGGGGGGGGFGGMFGGRGKPKVNMKRHAAGTIINGKKVGGQMYNAGKNVKPGMGGMAKLGAGLGLGAVGMGLNYGADQMGRDSGAGKAFGIAGRAAEYAGYGAMLGPWGMAGGALLGAGMGAYDAFKPRTTRSDEQISMMNDGIIQFNPRDKFTTVDDAILASTSENQLNVAAKTLTKGGGGDSKVNVDFGKVDINLNLNVTGIDDEIGKSMLNKTDFKQRITTMIHEVSREALSHKLSPNPI